MKLYTFFFLCVLLAANLMASDKRAMTVDDMWAMKRLGSVTLSPDGKNILFGQTEYDMQANKGVQQIWLMPVTGGNPTQLTTHASSSSSPQWLSNDSFAFLSSRGGSSQIYKLNLQGGEAQQLTNLPVDVESFLFSADGKKIAFTATVFADAATLQETADRDAACADAKVQARVIDHLLYRSWDRWTDGKYTHVFVCEADGANVQDLTPGEFDAPPLDLGGSQDFVFSPDGSELAFVSNHSEMPAANTNNDIFLIPINGGKAVNLTADNKAVDNQPLYSPDGNFLVYKAMQRPGFEADQYDIILYDRLTQTKTVLTDGFDRNPAEIIWSPKSDKLYFNAEDEGNESIYELELAGRKISKIVEKHCSSNLNISPDGKMLYFRQMTNMLPFEIFSCSIKKQTVQQLSFVNQPLLDQLEMLPLEDFWYTSFDGQKVQGLMVKPPFFDAAKKYPMMLLIHGGPQGMWSDDFHYRWNSSMFAAPGYVVVMLNIRGSKGYGQEWCDAVSKNWGGGPYEDLMAGVDFVVDNYDFIDASKLVAAGASYGGFMINWIATHTDRFKALVCHDGVYDQRSMYGATEELWFPEWEFGGTPYENPELYEKWSPSTYAKNLATFKTPTLVIHGERDFRVPVTQAFQMFTALQRQGVPSRFLYFPDETHFVTKPQNAKLWWSEVFAWTDKWIDQ